MTNKLINRDLILNLLNLVMPRDKMYAFIKKITPLYWYTRPTTKYIIKNFKKESLVIAEIGVNYGLNAKNILKFLPIKKLYLIDPYEEELDGVSGDERFKSAQFFLSKYNRKIRFIRKVSEEAVKDIPDNLDFVYIDGNHMYEYVKRDIELYFPKVKKGGIIGGHDFWGSQTDVCKAVFEFVNKNNLKLNGEFTDWWIIK